MSALELLMYTRRLRREGEAEGVLELKLGRTKTLSLTGTTAVSEAWSLHLLEGSASCLDAMLMILDCYHQAGDYKVLERRAIPMREFGSLTALRLRLLPTEARWLDEELARETPDPVRLQALLSWSAFRQAEMALSCQGELAWRTETEFPALRLN